MLKLILADDQAIFRAGAAKVLGVEDDIRVVSQVENFAKLTLAMEKFRPGLLIFSTALQGDLKAVVELARKHKTKLVVIAESGESASQFMTAGIQGVIYRNVPSKSLVDCVRKVMAGESWMQDTEPSEQISENDMVGTRVRDQLTKKELKIVAFIVQGYKNKEIATQLSTTEQVIKNYLRNVYDKIGVSDRLELALFTIHHRILAQAAAASTDTELVK